MSVLLEAQCVGECWMHVHCWTKKQIITLKPDYLCSNGLQFTIHDSLYPKLITWTMMENRLTGAHIHIFSAAHFFLVTKQLCKTIASLLIWHQSLSPSLAPLFCHLWQRCLNFFASLSVSSVDALEVCSKFTPPFKPSANWDRLCLLSFWKEWTEWLDGMKWGKADVQMEIRLKMREHDAVEDALLSQWCILSNIFN